MNETKLCNSRAFEKQEISIPSDKIMSLIRAILVALMWSI